MTTQPPTDDAIELLREQIRAATDAAERLVRETVPAPAAPRASAEPGGPGPGGPGPGGPGGAASGSGGAGPGGPGSGSGAGGRGPRPGGGSPPPRADEVPPRGWDSPDSHRAAASELEALGRLFSTVRELLPDELQQQVTELIRQLLLVLRALIDWAVARIERGPRGRETEVEDIPIV